MEQEQVEKILEKWNFAGMYDKYIPEFLASQLNYEGLETEGGLKIMFLNFVEYKIKSSKGWFRKD